MAASRKSAARSSKSCSSTRQQGGGAQSTLACVGRRALYRDSFESMTPHERAVIESARTVSFAEQGLL